MSTQRPLAEAVARVFAVQPATVWGWKKRRSVSFEQVCRMLRAQGLIPENLHKTTNQQKDQQ